MENIKLLEFIRSLGFGGMLGSGLLGLVYFSFPDLFGQNAEFQNVIIVGGFIGVGLHNLIDSMFMKTFVKPFGRSVVYYGKLLQLLAIRRSLTAKQYNEIYSKLTYDYFLEPKKDNALLPNNNV